MEKKDTTSTFIWVEDGNGMKFKYVNFDNPNICPREGIIEIESMKKKDAERSLSNNAGFASFTDHSTGIIWGIPTGIHRISNQIQHQRIKLGNSTFFHRDNQDEAKKCAIILKAIELGKFKDTNGRPRFKIRDKEKSAQENIDARTNRRKALDIVEGLTYGDELKDIARNLGIDPDTLSPLVLADRVATAVELKPKDFLEMYNSPLRPYLTILKNAQSMGVIEFNPLDGFKYGGYLLGKTQDLAITELSKKPDMANSIAAQTAQKRQASIHATQVIHKLPIETKSSREMELEKELAEMKAMIMAKKTDEPSLPKEEVKVSDDFNGDMERLRAKAKALGVKGWHIPKTSYATLLAKVIAKEAEVTA